MSLPKFLCVGAQKSGTTTLQAILQQHPDIYLPATKETHFFDDGKFGYENGIEWYESEYFSRVPPGALPGEISTNYMFLEYIPRRIYEHLGPDTKLIFMLREPSARAFSQYRMNIGTLMEKLPFETALEKEAERSGESEFYRKVFGYAERGLYARQIRRFLEYFPRSRMFFIVFETDFLSQRAETVNALCRFLEVDPFDFRLDIRANPMSTVRFPWLHRLVHDPAYARLRQPLKLLTGSDVTRWRLKHRLRLWNRRPFEEKERPRMAPETERRLKEYFRPEVLELEELIGRDLDCWR